MIPAAVLILHGPEYTQAGQFAVVSAKRPVNALRQLTGPQD